MAHPLTEDQTELLLAVIREEKLNVAAAAGHSSPAFEQNPGDVQAILEDESAADKLLQTQEVVNQRVYERARDVLSPDQLEAFARFQTNQLQVMRVGMGMARQFMVPKPELNQDAP
jgi:hypothetical protein